MPLVTAQSDCAYLAEVAKHSYSSDALRATLTRRLLGVAQVAEQRYLAGGEGATVEGRLMIDASARVAKMHGLDDSVISQEVAPALARLFDAMSERLAGDRSDDDGIVVGSA